MHSSCWRQRIKLQVKRTSSDQCCGEKLKQEPQRGGNQASMSHLKLVLLAKTWRQWWSGAEGWCLRETSAEGLKIAKEEARDLGNGSPDGSVQTKAGSEALARLANSFPVYLSPDSRSEVPYHTSHHRNWCDQLVPLVALKVFPGFQPRRSGVSCCHWRYTVETMHHHSFLFLCCVCSAKAWGL